VVEEEAKSVLAGLERTAGCAPLAQLQEIAPYFFFGELIGCAAVLCGQPTYRADVHLLRSLGQASQVHIVDHPRA
jgi:hypothetical protein